MLEHAFLKDFVVILGSAVVVVMLLRPLKVPFIAGFIVAGVLLGPYTLGLVGDVHEVQLLAELGVVLLLFGVGLEMSLERMRSLWRAIAIGGAIQVGATIAAVVGIGILLDWDVRAAVLLGFVVAVSSTAIVLRGLSSRGELETPHGRLVLGILLFQDLCVIPMVLTIPLLASDAEFHVRALFPLLKAAGVIALVLLAARFVVPRVLGAVAKTRRRDLFVLTVFLLCMGTAWVVSLVGISLALGGFLAGIVVSGSEYRDQAISDLVPLRDVFASVFFVSVGMLLDPRVLGAELLPILIAVVAIVCGKFGIIFLVTMLMRLPLRVCILTGAALSQVGEFAFVLLHASKGTGLLEGRHTTIMTAAIIISMLITPFLLVVAPHVAGSVSKMDWLSRLIRDRSPLHSGEHSGEPGTRSGHVIIGGYGLAGRELSHSLRGRSIPYLIVDINIDNIKLADREGEPTQFGDLTSPEVLRHVGLADAAALAIAINDTDAALRATAAARRVSSEIPIAVRTTYLNDADRLLAAGATKVIVAEETAAAALRREILSCVLSEEPVHGEEDI